MKTAIVIIAFNKPDLLIKQVEKIQQFCTDDHDVIVVDNSNKKDAIEGIRHHATRLGCQYMKTNSGNSDGSLSHSFAANLSYIKLKDSYDYFLYLDHDCFPVKPFSVIENLGDNVIAGIGQNKSKTYVWPGCVMFKKDDLIDFGTNREFQLDTGGNLYKVMEHYGHEKCLFFDEQYCENIHFKSDTRYSYYSLINDGMFFHMVGGSNWMGIEKNEERINSLLNILDSITG